MPADCYLDRGSVVRPMSVSAAAAEKAAFPVATPESQGVSAAAVRAEWPAVEEYVRNGTIVRRATDNQEP